MGSELASALCAARPGLLNLRMQADTSPQRHGKLNFTDPRPFPNLLLWTTSCFYARGRGPDIPSSHGDSRLAERSREELGGPGQPRCAKARTATVARRKLRPRRTTPTGSQPLGGEVICVFLFCVQKYDEKGEDWSTSHSSV